MRFVRLACCAAVAALLATGANATTYRYSYIFDTGDVLRGILQGSTQADGNTIHVHAIGATSLEGNPFPADSDDLYSQDGDIAGWAHVTFDGSIVDFVVANQNKGNGFNLHSALNFAGYMLPAGLGSRTAWGEAYDPKAWSITAVPLPASLPLLLGAIGTLALARRRHARAS